MALDALIASHCIWESLLGYAPATVEIEERDSCKVGCKAWISPCEDSFAEQVIPLLG